MKTNQKFVPRSEPKQTHGKNLTYAEKLKKSGCKKIINYEETLDANFYSKIIPKK